MDFAFESPDSIKFVDETSYPFSPLEPTVHWTVKYGLIPKADSFLALTVSLNRPATATYHFVFEIQTFPDTIPTDVGLTIPHPGGNMELQARATSGRPGGVARLYDADRTLLGHAEFDRRGQATFSITPAAPGDYFFTTSSSGNYWLTVSGHEHPAGLLRPTALERSEGPPFSVPQGGSGSWEHVLTFAPLELALVLRADVGNVMHAQDIVINMSFPGGETKTLVADFCQELVTDRICANPDLSVARLDGRLVAGTYRFEYSHANGANVAVVDVVTGPPS